MKKYLLFESKNGRPKQGLPKAKKNQVCTSLRPFHHKRILQYSKKSSAFGLPCMISLWRSSCLKQQAQLNFLFSNSRFSLFVIKQFNILIINITISRIENIFIHLLRFLHQNCKKWLFFVWRIMFFMEKIIRNSNNHYFWLKELRNQINFNRFIYKWSIKNMYTFEPFFTSSNRVRKHVQNKEF